MRFLKKSIAQLVTVAMLIVPTASVLGQDKPLALTPEVQTAEWAKAWWMPRHEQKLKEKEGLKQVDLLWIGDSITHGWENGGKDVWEKYYASRNAFNIGFSGDRTEQVLWRIDHGAIDGLTPKVAVIMIGTNNTGHRKDPAEQTAKGIEAIVKAVHAKTPKTQIVVLAIFPRGESTNDPLRMLNEEINKQTKELLASDSKVTFLNLNSAFLDADRVLSKSIMPDLLHPNTEGYTIWAKSLEPTLVELLK